MGHIMFASFCSVAPRFAMISSWENRGAILSGPRDFFGEISTEKRQSTWGKLCEKKYKNIQYGGDILEDSIEARNSA